MRIAEIVDAFPRGARVLVFGLNSRRPIYGAVVDYVQHAHAEDDFGLMVDVECGHLLPAHPSCVMNVTSILNSMQGYRIAHLLQPGNC